MKFVVFLEYLKLRKISSEISWSLGAKGIRGYKNQYGVNYFCIVIKILITLENVLSKDVFLSKDNLYQAKRIFLVLNIKLTAIL